MSASDLSVYVGKDGWLFLSGGSNEVGRLYFEQGYLGSDIIAQWRSLLEKRASQFASRGIQYVHMWIPDKLFVYREFLGADLGLVEQPPTSAVMSASLSGALLDLLPALNTEKTTGKLLYWKTDTHWTYYGVLAAYKAICDRLGVETNPDLWMRPMQEMELTLDLGGKLTPAVKEKWALANVLAKAKPNFKNEMVKFLELLAPKFQSEMHVGASIGFSNEKAISKKRMLVFGDSYSEYRPHMLTGVFAETFTETRFVWSASVDYGLVDAFKPDIVITETADRFVARVPADDLQLERYVHGKIAEFLNRRCNSGSHIRFSYKD